MSKKSKIVKNKNLNKARPKVVVKGVDYQGCESELRVSVNRKTHRPTITHIRENGLAERFEIKNAERCRELSLFFAQVRVYIEQDYDPEFLPVSFNEFSAK